MDASQQQRFEQLYQQRLSAPRLQGMRPKTVDLYRRAVHRACTRAFHRTGDFGLLHPKRSAQLRRIQLMLEVRLPPAPEPEASRTIWRSPHCGGALRLLATRLPPRRSRRKPDDHAKPSDVM